MSFIHCMNINSMLSLISSTKCQLYSLIHLQITGHCQCPKWMDVRGILLRVTMSKVAWPDIIPCNVLKKRANQLAEVNTFVGFYSHKRLSPPAPRQPSSSLHLKILQCLVRTTTALWHLPPFCWITLRNWLRSTSKTTSQPAWTITSMQWEPTDSVGET